MNDYISIAKILNFHGINGELKLGFTKGKDEQIANLKEIFLYLDDEYKPFKVSSVRFHKQFAIMKLKEFNNINEILQFKGENIFIKRETVESNLKQDEYLIDDLIGSEVLNQNNEKIGVVKNIEENAAGSLLAIATTKHKNCLVPFINQFVTKVDTQKKQIIINEIEGLID